MSKKQAKKWDRFDFDSLKTQIGFYEQNMEDSPSYWEYLLNVKFACQAIQTYATRLEEAVESDLSTISKNIMDRNSRKGKN